MKNQKGFTIIELIIASSAFGVIMLVATTGIITIGRSYYKGLISARTQDATRTIMNDLTRGFQYGAEKQIGTPYTNYTVGTFEAVCFGNVRYTYIKNMPVKGYVGNGATLHAMWVDIKNSTGCYALDLGVSDPQDIYTVFSGGADKQRRELIPANMRLDTLEFPDTGNPSLLKIDLKVIYGDLDLSPLGQCVSNNDGGQFCATSTLSTSVKKRL